MILRESAIVKMTTAEYYKLQEQICQQRKYIRELENKLYIANSRVISLCQSQIENSNGKGHKKR
jgi:hypothetical protein